MQFIMSQSMRTKIQDRSLLCKILNLPHSYNMFEFIKTTLFFRIRDYYKNVNVAWFLQNLILGSNHNF